MWRRWAPEEKSELELWREARDAVVGGGAGDSDDSFVSPEQEQRADTIVGPARPRRRSCAAVLGA